MNDYEINEFVSALPLQNFKYTDIIDLYADYIRDRKYPSFKQKRLRSPLCSQHSLTPSQTSTTTNEQEVIEGIMTDLANQQKNDLEINENMPNIEKETTTNDLKNEQKNENIQEDDDEIENVPYSQQFPESETDHNDENQSNKTKTIAENFDVVQSLDRIKIAKRLNEQRPENLRPLEVLIQVNISNEPQKSGISIAELPALIAEVHNCPRLILKGFMGIATDTTDSQKISKEFNILYEIFKEAKITYPQIDILSMGMSGDLGQAITAGSTMVRIGSAIFGARNYPNKGIPTS